MKVYISNIVVIDSKKEAHTISDGNKIDVEIKDMTQQQHKPNGRSSIQFQQPETTVIIKNAEVQKAIKPFAGKKNEATTFSIRLTSAKKIYILDNASVLKEEDSIVTIYAPSKIRARRNNG